MADGVPFWRRLVTAWAAATSLFTLLFLVYAYFQMQHGSSLVQVLQLARFWVLLAFILAAIFVIAWPIESFWVKAGASTWSGVSKYLIVIPALGALGYAYLRTKATADTDRFYPGLDLFVVGVVTVVALFVACVGRAIYPALLRQPIVSYVLAAATLALGAISL